MKKIAVFVLFSILISSVLAERRKAPPRQLGIRSAPMAKQQGEPADTEPAPQDHNESARAYRK